MPFTRLHPWGNKDELNMESTLHHQLHFKGGVKLNVLSMLISLKCLFCFIT